MKARNLSDDGLLDARRLLVWPAWPSIGWAIRRGKRPTRQGLHWQGADSTPDGMEINKMII